MDITIPLVILHLAGTVLGVGGATLIEVHIHKALRDGKRSDDEKALFASTFTVVRIGLLLCVVTGIGFIVQDALTGHVEKLHNPMFWFKQGMVFIIVANAVLLHIHKISLYWGSALSLVSWWSAAIVGVLNTRHVGVSVYVAIAIYIGILILGAFLLDTLRKRALPKPQNPPPPAETLVS